MQVRLGQAAVPEASLSAAVDETARETADRGVLPFQCLHDAVRDGWIRSPDFSEGQLQPASVDLRLGARAYRLKCSFLPDRSSAVEDKLEAFALDEIDLTQGAVLEKNRPYLIPLLEEISVPEEVRGRANPKSSVGRVDLFARVITDRNARFDDVPPGYKGRLYLEIVPRSFLVRVQSGLSVNQLRLIKGDPGEARCRDSDLIRRQMNEATALLFVDGKRVSAHDLMLSEGLFLGVGLQGGDDGLVGFRARKNSEPIDLSAIGRYRWEEFWEPIAPDSTGRLVLEPEEFYLLLSRESVVVPEDLAAEMAAYDPTAGELRTHYAGFFDPGFGQRVAKDDLRGSRATLEVRARDVAFAIEDGQPICKLVFEELLEKTELLYGTDIGSSYQRQRVTLSKHFLSQGPEGQLALPEAARARRQAEP